MLRMFRPHLFHRLAHTRLAKALLHSSRGMVFPFQCLTYVKKILVRMEERAEATKEDIHAAVSHNGLEKIASKV